MATPVKSPKNLICVWYDKDAEAAARFYAETFPDSAVRAIHHAPSDFPSGKAGQVLTVEFTVAGVHCIRKKQTATGTPSSAMAARKVCAAGAGTNGASIGRSHRAY